MGTNDIRVKICKSVSEAPVYRSPEYKGAQILQAVIVHGGTVNGNATVDLVFEDSNGQKYIAMITASLLSAVHEASLVKP